MWLSPSTGARNMDWSAVGAITSSISAARDIAKGLSAIRDQALISERTAALMEQLLKAQEGLLAHNTALLQIQQEHFEAREELRKLKEAASERGRYSLFEVSVGRFAYRVNVSPQQSGASEPGSAEPLHYLCQPCFDKGVKSVLQSMSRTDGLECPICKATLRASINRLYGRSAHTDSLS
jgi:hypothetical protein